MLGGGTLILTASNTYTGGTTITGGTLQLGAGGTTGSLAAAGAITDNGTLVFNRSNAATQGTDFSSAAISGSGSVIQERQRRPDVQRGQPLHGRHHGPRRRAHVGRHQRLAVHRQRSALAGGTLNLAGYSLSVPSLSLTGGTLSGSGGTLAVSGPGPIDAESGAALANLAGSVGLSKTQPAPCSSPAPIATRAARPSAAACCNWAATWPCRAPAASRVNAGTLDLDGNNPTVGGLQSTWHRRDSAAAAATATLTAGSDGASPATSAA